MIEKGPKTGFLRPIRSKITLAEKRRREIEIARREKRGEETKAMVPLLVLHCLLSEFLAKKTA